MNDETRELSPAEQTLILRAYPILTADLSTLRAENAKLREVVRAANVLREYVDREYNEHPARWHVMNCAEQQALWRALDAALA